MAIRITLEKCANGTTGVNRYPKTLNQCNPTQDKEVIILEPATKGGLNSDAILWSYLQLAIGVFQNGTLGTPITAIASGSNLQVCLVSAVTEQIGV